MAARHSGAEPASPSVRRHSTGDSLRLGVVPGSTGYRYPEPEEVVISDGPPTNEVPHATDDSTRRTRTRETSRSGETTSRIPRQPPAAKTQPQRVLSDQMGLSGAPFPGYDNGDEPEDDGDDGIFIGLELPDPRTLGRPGHDDH